MKPGTAFTLEVNPKIPLRLIRLEELANNLWYSWHRPTRTLFARLDPRLWYVCNHAPKEFLRRVDEKILLDAAEDPVFLANYNQILSAYDTYQNPLLRHSEQQASIHLIAYFCAEFGLHESFPIYSGGLGILAGDHCKSASDLRLPFVGMGLLYRRGYFLQQIDAEGNQIAFSRESDFDDLPVSPVRRQDGSEVIIQLDFLTRHIAVKIWQAHVGRVSLYLLDTDISQNTAEDREITYQLYGGDRETRLKQEFVLGVGGVLALHELSLKPSCWHINEGHAAFLVIARILNLVKQGIDFSSALEAVASNTIFTTHTAVPAGHDQFSPELITQYFNSYCHELKIKPEQLLVLGQIPKSTEFNMTALAIRGSRFHNGVSKIHGDVSARICSHLWPEIEPEENPLSYVTNGVHVPTFLAQEWIEIFDRYLGHEWRHNLRHAEFWSNIDQIPDHVFWSVRQSLKSQMFYATRDRFKRQNARNSGSESHLDRMLKFADPLDLNILTIGFARRFATYKRATLLFTNLDWLRRILSQPARRVLFIFSGKAHPADIPSQDLIRVIHKITHMPEFEGRVLLVENYDLGYARRLLSGVDVWLNNPIYPLEACGTSGMKAGMNGVINLSVLDGWWEEGYTPGNGWAIKPAPENVDEARRAREESQTLYEILEDQIIPLYYERGKLGYPEAWVKMSKRSMATLLPRFNSTRMVSEYLERFYHPAHKQWQQISVDNFVYAKQLSSWKEQIRAAWNNVSLRRLDIPVKRIELGSHLHIEIAVRLQGLKPEDVIVEFLSARPSKVHTDKLEQYKLVFQGNINNEGEHIFILDLAPHLCGKLEYKIRIYPYHRLLTHPLEMGLMKWL